MLCLIKYNKRKDIESDVCCVMVSIKQMVVEDLTAIGVEMVLGSFCISVTRLKMMGPCVVLKIMEAPIISRGRRKDHYFVILFLQLDVK